MSFCVLHAYSCYRSLSLCIVQQQLHCLYLPSLLKDGISSFVRGEWLPIPLPIKLAGSSQSARKER